MAAVRPAHQAPWIVVDKEPLSTQSKDIITERTDLTEVIDIPPSQRADLVIVNFPWVESDRRVREMIRFEHSQFHKSSQMLSMSFHRFLTSYHHREKIADIPSAPLEVLQQNYNASITMARLHTLMLSIRAAEMRVRQKGQILLTTEIIDFMDVFDESGKRHLIRSQYYTNAVQGLIQETFPTLRISPAGALWANEINREDIDSSVPSTPRGYGVSYILSAR